MSDLTIRSYNEGLTRAADSMLRSQGGFAVGLRLPVPAAIGVDAEQLGLSAPHFQDLPLAPVVFRKARVSMQEGQANRRELLISPSAVAAAVSVQQVASADILFAMATGIVINGLLFLIEATSFTEWLGNVCLYHVQLRQTIPDAAEETVS